MGMRFTGVPRFCMKLNKSSRNSFLLGSASSSYSCLTCSLYVQSQWVWWLQLRCRMGNPSGDSWAGPRALLATQCWGPTVTAEGLVWLSLAGEQGCGAQAGDAQRPKPLLVLIDLILLVLFVEGGGVGGVAHSRVYRNLLPQPHRTGPTRGAHTPHLASGPGHELCAAGS